MQKKEPREPINQRVLALLLRSCCWKLFANVSCGCKPTDGILCNKSKDLEKSLSFTHKVDKHVLDGIYRARRCSEIAPQFYSSTTCRAVLFFYATFSLGMYNFLRGEYLVHAFLRSRRRVLIHAYLKQADT